MTEEYKSQETAFLYVDGKVYYGHNHVELMEKAGLSDQWGSLLEWATPHKMAMGWIWNNKDDTQTAEFFSDHYEAANNSLLFDEVYDDLKKQFPKLVSLTFGPDKDTWEEMQNSWSERNTEGDISTAHDLLTSKVANTFDPHRLLDYLWKDVAAVQVYEALEDAGGRVFVVGGAIRDTLLGKQPKDIDLMVTGLKSNDINKALRNLSGHTTYAGKNFGVFHYQHGGYKVEVAMPRTEESTGQGHKDFEVQYNPDLPVEQDLSRRDFTANAMAFDIDNKTLIDPHKGQYDIAGKTLRLINPQAFRDDPLRIIRAIVAYSVHGLMPDENTLQEMTENANKIRHLPGERVKEELDKLLSGTRPAQALAIAQETGVLDYLCPELGAGYDFEQNNPHHEMTVGDHSLAVLSHVAHLSDDPDVRLAALLHDIGKPDTYWEDEAGTGHYYQNPEIPGSEDHETRGAQMATQFMRRLGYSNDRISRVHNLIQNHMFPYYSTEKGARKFIASSGNMQAARDLLNIREGDIKGKVSDQQTVNPTDLNRLEIGRALLDKASQQKVTLSPKDLAINGSDLMQIGIPAGPQLGQILKALVKETLENPELNNRDSLLEYARRLFNEPSYS